MTTPSRYEHEREVVGTASKVRHSLTRTDRQAAADLMLDVSPWVHFVAPEAGQAFVTEFVKTPRASGDLDHFAPCGNSSSRGGVARWLRGGRGSGAGARRWFPGRADATGRT